jgi:hypothetical protein
LLLKDDSCSVFFLVKPLLSDVTPKALVCPIDAVSLKSLCFAKAGTFLGYLRVAELTALPFLMFKFLDTLGTMVVFWWILEDKLVFSASISKEL